MNEHLFWRDKLLPFTTKSDTIGAWQTLNTIIPLVSLWIAYAYLVESSRWVVVPFTVVLTLFNLRSFVMMHDCGHGSLFKTRRANQIVGFIFGVITGMPQFVWSKNHAFHHNTNGDWVRYGGVFNILSTDRYAKLSEKEKHRYWLLRHPLILIPAGFVYVLFNPRFNWIMGHLTMVTNILRPLVRLDFKGAMQTARAWETNYWKGKSDYLHMTYNNVVLLSLWYMMAQWIGTVDFFLLYVLSTSLAGSVGILLFAIQHNFEDSYATDTARVNHFRAALEGTSMLVLPKVLNWFTADIAYHHVHHLSIAIPNYRLEGCHKEYLEHFAGVKRVYLCDLLGTFDFLLWDTDLQKIVPRAAAR